MKARKIDHIAMLREPTTQDVVGKSDAFIALLRERVWATAGQHPTLAESALCALSVLQQMIRREAGEVRFDEGLADSLVALSAEPPVERALTALYESCRQVLFELIRKDRVTGISPLSLLESVDVFLEWYAHRAQSREHVSQKTSLETRGSEAVARVTVIHDVERQGLSGFLVRGLLVLDSRGGDVLWAKVSLAVKGVTLKPRAGWETWSDGKNFAVLYPIDLSDHRAVGRHIIDDLEFFIPSEAFEIPEGLRGKVADATVTVSLEDNDGRRVCGWSVNEQLRLLSRGNRAIPAPHEVEVWDRAVGHGVQMRCVEVQGAKSDVIKLAGLVTSIGGAEGSELTVCLIDSEGFRVHVAGEAASPPFELRCPLTLTPLAATKEFSVEIPLQAVKWHEGVRTYLVEITVRDPSQRIIAGLLEPITVSS